jgi:hypothetical protein
MNDDRTKQIIFALFLILFALFLILTGLLSFFDISFLSWALLGYGIWSLIIYL